MVPEFDDSIFEQALRADLPSAEEAERMRRRLFVAGAAIGSGLAATQAAASTEASWGATVAAKIAALSWPATLVLTAVVATPIVALPMWLTPSPRTVSVSPERAPLRIQVATAPKRLALGTSVPAEPRASAVPAELPQVTPPLNVRATRNPAPATEATAPSFTVQPEAAPPAVPRAAETTVSTLAPETALLDRAFAELRAGHRGVAAALIAEHEQKYPNGLLRVERERARARLTANLQGE